MMAPRYHPAMKIVSPVRKRLKVKTVFNILGPMLNPGRVSFAVVGVYKEELVSISIKKKIPFFHSASSSSNNSRWHLVVCMHDQ